MDSERARLVDRFQREWGRRGNRSFSIQTVDFRDPITGEPGEFILITSYSGMRPESVRIIAPSQMDDDLESQQ